MIEPFLYPLLPLSKRSALEKRQSLDENLSSQVPQRHYLCRFLSGIRNEEAHRCSLDLSVACIYSTDNRLDTPTFTATQRTRFNNLNHITDVTIIRFIVSQDLLRFSDNLLVKGMLIPTNNRNGNSFFHAVTRHKTRPNLTMPLSFFVQI